MEKAFNQAIDEILNKNDKSAKALIKKAITGHPKMKLYKNKLQEMGLDLKKVDIPDKIYDDIENVIKDYDRPVKLKVLDMVYKKIKTKK